MSNPWKSTHTFSAPWEVVVEAVWRKYPNPENENVVGLDVIDRKLTPDGCLHSHRLMKTLWNMPAMMRKIITIEPQYYVCEHSVVDRKNKIFKQHSRNITLNSWLIVDEEMTYSCDKNNPKMTHLAQSTRVQVNMGFLTSYLESNVIDMISKKSQSGRKAMDNVIDRIVLEAKDISTLPNQPFMSL